MSEGILFREVEVAPQGIVDVRLRDGIVAEIDADLPDSAGDVVIEGEGGALLPGLNDHHLHTFALAAALRSVRCGPPTVVDRMSLEAALRTAAGARPEDGWIRGIGYHESVAGALDRWALDEMVRDRPVRLQHRSGALWVLNSAGMSALAVESWEHPGVERDAEGRPTGRLWRLDEWIRDRTADQAVDLGEAGRHLAALGITGITDATPNLDAATVRALDDAARDGRLPQRLHLLGAPSGSALRGRVSVGPHKVLLPDHDLPSFDAIREEVSCSHREGRSVAVHCVTREALLLTLAVLAEVGSMPGDRIEHAAVVPPGAAEEMARLGLRVITQPGFIAERGDSYLRDVAAEDRALLYPYVSLTAAGVCVAPSSDAPFGPVDPWQVITAARHRLASNGASVGADEAVSPEVVLSGYLSPLDDPGGSPRRISVGVEADLCLLHVPRVESMRRPSRDVVRMTICAGRIVSGDH